MTHGKDPTLVDGEIEPANGPDPIGTVEQLPKETATLLALLDDDAYRADLCGGESIDDVNPVDAPARRPIAYVITSTALR